MELFVLSVVWLVSCGVVAYIAAARGRSSGAFFFLALLLSPLLAYAIVIALPDLAATVRAEEELERVIRRVVDAIEGRRAPGAVVPLTDRSARGGV